MQNNDTLILIFISVDCKYRPSGRSFEKIFRAAERRRKEPMPRRPTIRSRISAVSYVSFGWRNGTFTGKP